LAGIQLCGIEDLGVFIAMSPFAVRKGIGTKVDEHVILHILPVLLGPGRQCAIGLDGGLRLGGQQAGHHTGDQ